MVRDIPAGAPLIVEDLRASVSAQEGRAMSIPVSSAHAVGADLYVGDRVDVIAVEEGGSRYVASAIEVVDIRMGGNRTLGNDFGVVVAVSADEALAIAGALDGNAVHLVRSTGMDPINNEPRPSEAVVPNGEPAS